MENIDIKVSSIGAVAFIKNDLAIAVRDKDFSDEQLNALLKANGVLFADEMNTHFSHSLLVANGEHHFHLDGYAMADLRLDGFTILPRQSKQHLVLLPPIEPAHMPVPEEEHKLLLAS